MSKDKETNHMWYAYAAGTALGGIGYLFNEQEMYSYYNNFGWDYNYRLHQSLKVLEDNLQNKNLPEFISNKQHVQFLHLYPEKMKHVLELPANERNIFIMEAMKEQHSYEILLRDSFSDDQEIKYHDWKTRYPASDTLKTKIIGPWNIDASSHKLMKDLGENIHFDTLLKALALDNLDAKDNQRRILFSPIVDGPGGFADSLGRVFISTTFTVSEESLKSILTHEFSHRGMFLSNHYSSAAPYPKSSFRNSPIKHNFEDVMKQTLTNLHQQFIPNIISPSSLKKLASNLERYKESLAPQEEAIINAVSSSLFLNEHYKENSYHTEFVARLPQIIAELGELSPHIRDCFAPLEEYYKTQITPRWLEYIANHPRKEMLLSNDMDKYHPETILNRSGEDELMAKDQQKLTKPEKLLIAQIQKMQDLIKNSDVKAARTYLLELQDERVIRASLTTCIEHDSPLFNELFQAIKAPQYLGPQLILAVRLNRKEVTEKLLPQITNQYYLAKTVEMALESNNQDLLQEAIHGIKDEWFLSRAKNNSPNNAIITKAITDIIIDEGLNYLKDTHLDKLQTGLRILQFPSVQDFIRDKMQNLEYLINLDEATLTTTLEILENSQFKDWIGKNDYYTTDKLGYLATLDKDQLNAASEILENSQFKDWIGKNDYYTTANLGYLITLDKDQLNTASEILENSQFKDWIGKNDYYTTDKLGYLATLDKDQLNTASEILRNPLFKDWMDKNKAYMIDKFSYLVTLDKDQLNAASEILENSQFKDWIGKNDYYTTANLGYLITLDKDQLNTASEILRNPLFKDWMDKNKAYMIDKFSYLVTLDKDQLNTASEILGSKAGEEYISNHVTRLEYLLKLSKEQLTSQFNIEFKPQNHIPLPVINIAPLESTKLEQQITPPKLASNNILSSHNIISESDNQDTNQATNAQKNSASTGNIISQAALAISLAYAAKSMYVVLKKLLVNDRESKASESETKDLDKKLLSLHDQFEALYNKRAEKYKESPNDLLFEEVNNLKDLQNKAAHNLERLNNFNKLNKSTNIEELQREAAIIWKNYKELRKIKELSNSKKLDAIRDVIDSFKKAGVKQNENVNPKVVKMERSVALGARSGGEL